MEQAIHQVYRLLPHFSRELPFDNQNQRFMNGLSRIFIQKIRLPLRRNERSYLPLPKSKWKLLWGKISCTSSTPTERTDWWFWDNRPELSSPKNESLLPDQITQNQFPMLQVLPFSGTFLRYALRFTFLITIGLYATRAIAQGPFPPAAGQPGSTAIHKDAAAFKTWASGAQIVRGFVNISDTSVYVNGSNRASFGLFSNAIGQAQGSSTEIVSLGDGGAATLTFDRPIVNGPGFDFAVFENSFSDNFLELAFVEVSSDGQRFVRFPAVSLTQTQSQIGAFDPIEPTNLHNLAGKYRQGFGTPFDLSDLADSTGIDLNNIRFVRIVDAVGSINPAFATYDAQGNKVNDPFPTPFASGGFDLDAVGIINAGEQFRISHFDHFTLNAGGYWNGSDGSGGFTSGRALFPNNYNTAWASWSGWAYSNTRNTTTPGWTNQYSAIAGGGMSANAQDNDIYALAYVPTDFLSGTNNTIPVEVNFTNDSLFIVNGLYVTNSTMAALSMRDGDPYAKKFGGPAGNDPDFFKLKVFGVRQDNSITPIKEFYLADYRFADNRQDYIVTDWRWLDLSSLGPVKSLRFDLESSDVGMYGMNTPAYFCIDNLSLARPAQMVGLPVANNPVVAVYPNPFRENLNINAAYGATVSVFNLSGQLQMETRLGSEQASINTSQLKPGVYIVKVTNDGQPQTFKLIRQ